MPKEQIQFNISDKTEEVQDIIEQMPRKTPRLVVIIVISLASLLLFFGWIIKYPESVSGVVTISAQQAPVRLSAMHTGRLHLLASNKKTLNEGELIAYIESSTNINHFLVLDSVLRCKPNELKNNFMWCADNLALGELTVAYLQLLNSVEACNLYDKENSFSPRLKQLEIQLVSNKKLQFFLDKQLIVQLESKKISTQNLSKDSLQFFQLKSINELAYLNSKTAWLNAIQSHNTLQKEQVMTIYTEKDLEARLLQLTAEQKEYEQKLEMNLFSTYQKLKNQMNQWKQKYTFTAPYTGKLEMLKFWKENTFVKAGEEVFAILPSKNPVMAQVLIPSQGAGKVSTGQEVIIKLDDFPYLEYGAVTGKVKSISTISNQTEEIMAQSKVNSYLVNVELPEQLTTNYGTTLNFKHDIKGMAQILVKKRKLIERLFDNLKYIVNEE